MNAEPDSDLRDARNAARTLVVVRSQPASDVVKSVDETGLVERGVNYEDVHAPWKFVACERRPSDGDGVSQSRSVAMTRVARSREPMIF